MSGAVMSGGDAPGGDAPGPRAAGTPAAAFEDAAPEPGARPGGAAVVAPAGAEEGAPGAAGPEVGGRAVGPVGETGGVAGREDVGGGAVGGEAGVEGGVAGGEEGGAEDGGGEAPAPPGHAAPTRTTNPPCPEPPWPRRATDVTVCPSPAHSTTRTPHRPPPLVHAAEALGAGPALPPSGPVRQPTTTTIPALCAPPRETVAAPACAAGPRHETVPATAAATMATADTAAIRRPPPLVTVLTVNG
jgi:hypothetical protein